MRETMKERKKERVRWRNGTTVVHDYCLEKFYFKFSYVLVKYMHFKYSYDLLI